MFSTTNQVLRVFAFFILLSACSEKKPANTQTQSKISQPLKSPSQERTRSIANLDKSPMDIIYYPPDYPVLKMSGKTSAAPVARVIYSRPFKDGRIIFGDVVKYGAYWRLGANEATEIEFFTDVIIAGKKVKKGRYIIYCIPFIDKWTIKLNNDLFTWGLKIHSSGDLYSFDIPVVKLDNDVEAFTMEFQSAENGAQLVMAWDSVKTVLPIKYQEGLK